MQELQDHILKDRRLYFAIIGHIFLFLIIVLSLRLHSSAQPQKAPQLYLPSYVYQGKPETAKVVPVQAQQQGKKSDQKKSKHGLLKADKSKGADQQKAVQQTSQPQVKAKQPASRKPTPDNTTKSRVSEAVNLVGEKTMVKPLIEILGRSLGRYLQYPRMAYEFNLKGTSYVGFTLHPSGMVTDVKVVKSSGASILDDAALQGVKDMSPVQNVKPFVPKPEFLVVGVIFK